MSVKPSPNVEALWAEYVRSVIAAGLWTLPDGMTVEDVVASTTWERARWPSLQELKAEMARARAT